MNARETGARIGASLLVLSVLPIGFSALRREVEAGRQERTTTIRSTALTVGWQVAEKRTDSREIRLKLENPEYDRHPEMRLAAMFVTVAKGDPAFGHAKRLREKDITCLKPGDIRHTARFLTPFDGPLAVTFQEEPGLATNQ